MWRRTFVECTPVKRLLFFFSLLTLFCSAAAPLAGQATAPAFDCVTNDTLQWTNPSLSTCGPFLRTLVYRADNPDGPYTIIAELSDPNQDNLFDNVPAGGERFYFLRYEYDCPGIIFPNSDTLNNRLPEMVEIRYVSVIDSVLQLVWTPSPSPQTVAYVIYRQELTGFVPLDTVFGRNSTTFSDPSFRDAGTQPGADATYTITAIDGCGNNSLFAAEVRPVVLTDTMFLDAGGCNLIFIARFLNLDTTRLQRPDALDIFGSLNGGPFLINGMDNSPLDIGYFGFASQDSVCIYVEGIIDGTQERFRTVQLCFRAPDVPGTVSFASAAGATFTPDNRLFIEGSVGPVAAVVRLTLLSSNSEAFPDYNLTDFNLADLLLPVPDNAAAPFGFTVQDECGNLVPSNLVTPTILSGTETSGTNRLQWTAFGSELASEIEYELVRIDADGTEETITTLGEGRDLSFADPADPFGSCYYVRILARIEGETRPGRRQFRSNTVCLAPAPDLYLPNVFSPSAVAPENRDFGPFFGPGPLPEEYELSIFDRWGGRLFVSNDPNRRWDGVARGKFVPAGVYLYVISYRIQSGEERRFSRTVTVIY